MAGQERRGKISMRIKERLHQQCHICKTYFDKKEKEDDYMVPSLFWFEIERLFFNDLFLKRVRERLITLWN